MKFGWSILTQHAVQKFNKVRPAIVLNHDHIGRLPLKLVVPITDWKPVYSQFVWFVPLIPNQQNGLRKESSADIFQLRSISLERFLHQIGALSENDIEKIATAITVCVGYEE